MSPMSNQQRLALVNSSQLLEAWRAANDTAKGYRYGLRWKTVNGKKVLFRQADRGGNGKVVRPADGEAVALLAKFHEGKERAKARLAATLASLDEQARLNKALRVSRAPGVVGRICRALDGEGLAKDFLVIGTNALFAYEAGAGVLFLMELLASGDIDLPYDARKRLTLVSQKLGGDGLTGLLRKADRSFQPLAKRHYRAVNDDGFLVDLVVPPRGITAAEPVTFSLDDLEAAEVPGLQWLINSPKYEAVVADEQGVPFRLRVPDPRVFALHKAWLSTRPEREPLKRPRDLAQAREVAAAVREQMPHLPFVSGNLTALHGDVRDAMSLLDGASG